MHKEAEQGFHPSSLSLYINCSLQFYLARLLKIRESDELEETIDNRILGIVVHECLNELFSVKLNQKLDKQFFSDAAKKIKKEVEKQFLKEMSDGDLDRGKNFLIVNVAEKMLKMLFRKETVWLEDGKELFIKGLEKQLRTSLILENDLTITFSGKIDRIDSHDGVLRILDYKSGFVEAKQLRFKEWDDLIRNPDLSKAFQLMMYSWLYHKNTNEKADIGAGIISLRAPGDGPVLVNPPGGVMDNNSLKAFEEQLITLMKEIVDPDIPFVQTEEESRCKNCSFKEICNRIASDKNY